MALAERSLNPQVKVRFATARDAPLLHLWRSEPSVCRFQPLQEVSTAQLRADVASQNLADLCRGRGEKFQWIVEVDGQPAGWITLAITNWEHGLAEVGYALSSAFQRRGVMVQALSQVLGTFVRNSPVERIEARCAVGNRASQRVLEKLGFRREGRLRSYFRLRGRRVDNFLYAILREELAEVEE